MSNKNNDFNLKEKLKQALSSTIRVISDDFNIKKNFTIAILGMGRDGHLASIFNNSHIYKKLIDLINEN